MPGHSGMAFLLGLWAGPNCCSAKLRPPPPIFSSCIKIISKNKHFYTEHSDGWLSPDWLLKSHFISNLLSFIQWVFEKLKQLFLSKWKFLLSSAINFFC